MRINPSIIPSKTLNKKNKWMNLIFKTKKMVQLKNNNH